MQNTSKNLKNKSFTLANGIVCICLLLMPILSFADVSWRLKLTSGKNITVIAKPEGKFISYILKIKKQPPLLLLKIFKTQEIKPINQYGFISIADANIAERTALFELAVNSSASGTGQGQCGAGIEKYIFMVSLIPSPTTVHRIPLESCWIDLSLPDDGTPKQAKINDSKFISINDDKLIIHYDYFPRLNGRMIATYSLLDDFFSLDVIKPLN